MPAPPNVPDAAAVTNDTVSVSTLSHSLLDPLDVFLQTVVHSKSTAKSSHAKCDSSNAKELRIKHTRRVHHHTFKSRLAQVLPIQLPPAEFGDRPFVVVQVEHVGALRLGSGGSMWMNGLVVLLLRRDLFDAVEKARANDEPVSMEELTKSDSPSSCACGALFAYEMGAGTDPFSTQPVVLHVFREPREAVRSFKAHRGFQVDSDFAPLPPPVPSVFSLMDTDQSSAAASPAGTGAVAGGAFTMSRSLEHQQLSGGGLVLLTLDSQLQLFDWDSLSISAVYSPASAVLAFDMSPAPAPVDKLLVLTADRQIHHLSLVRTPRAHSFERSDETADGELSATASRDLTDLDDRMLHVPTLVGLNSFLFLFSIRTIFQLQTYIIYCTYTDTVQWTVYRAVVPLITSALVNLSMCRTLSLLHTSIPTINMHSGTSHIHKF